VQTQSAVAFVASMKVGSGFRVPGSGFRVPGSGFRVPGSGGLSGCAAVRLCASRPCESPACEVPALRFATAGTTAPRFPGSIRTDRRTDAPTHRRTDAPTYRRTDVPTYRRTDVPTYRRTDVPTYRRTDVPTYRRTRTDAPTHRLPTSDFRLPTSDFRLPTSDFRFPGSGGLRSEIGASVRLCASRPCESPACEFPALRFATAGTTAPRFPGSTRTDRRTDASMRHCLQYQCHPGIGDRRYPGSRTLVPGTTAVRISSVRGPGSPLRYGRDDSAEVSRILTDAPTHRRTDAPTSDFRLPTSGFRQMGTRFRASR
jgi:hypothetical protein